MLSKKIATTRVGVIRARARRVLERAELVPARDLEHRKVLREREDVEHEQLELHPVWLGRLDALA